MGQNCIFFNNSRGLVQMGRMMFCASLSLLHEEDSIHKQTTRFNIYSSKETDTSQFDNIIIEKD